MKARKKIFMREMMKRLVILVLIFCLVGYKVAVVDSDNQASHTDCFGIQNPEE